MAIRIAQASKDERNQYHGGTAGNQTGQELNIRTWYSRPWDTIIRPKTLALAEKIANVAQILAKCQKIGYDQYQRVTLWNECVKIGWDINRINEIGNCECDCSSLVAVILKFCGVNIPSTSVTWTLEASCKNTGQFDILKDSKYLTTDQYIRKGDILLNTNHHVAVAIDSGVYGKTATPTQTGTKVSYAAQVNVSTFLNVRTGAGTSYPILKVNGNDFTLPNGIVVAIVEELDGWGRINDINGWISLAYTKR